MQIFTNANYNFIRWRWHAIIASLVVVIAGVAVIVTRGMPLSIDFTGGTALVLKFESNPTEEQLRDAISGVAGDKIVQQYGEAANRDWLVRLPMMQGAEEGASLEQASLQVERMIASAGLPKFEVSSRELVGPVIGQDLQKRGIYATLASILAITVYIGFRFRFSFAVGAIAATFHDILVTVAFLAFFGYDLSLNVVAALLTITGYSVNDTIVVFDRVRENLRSLRRESLEHVVNLSVNQTLARTVITAGTTFLSVLALFLFGGEALRGFAFTMLVGIVSGTYSTIFIASSIAIILSKGKGRQATPAVSGETTTGQPGRKPRRARAS